MKRMTKVVAMVEHCRVDSVNVLTKDSAWAGAQMCRYSSCNPWQCLFGCSNGWHWANGSSDHILVDAADGLPVAGIAGCQA